MNHFLDGFESFLEVLATAILRQIPVFRHRSPMIAVVKFPRLLSGTERRATRTRVDLSCIIIFFKKIKKSDAYMDVSRTRNWNVSGVDSFWSLRCHLLQCLAVNTSLSYP